MCSSGVIYLHNVGTKIPILYTYLLYSYSTLRRKKDPSDDDDDDDDDDAICVKYYIERWVKVGY